MRIPVTLIILIITLNSFNQEPVYFNNIYNPVNTYASGRGILQIDNHYYGIFGTLESSGYWYNIGLFKMNLTGDLIEWNLIGENGYDYFAGSVGGTLIQTLDGNLAFACHVGNPGPTIGTLVKLNLELDTIWQKMYQIGEQYTMTIKVKQTTDGGYVIVGQVYPGTGYYFDALIIKTDSLGNEQWYNTFGVNSDASEYGTDVIETPDGGYLIGGMRDIETIDHSLDAMLIKTDSLGNEEWTETYGNPWVDDDMAMVSMTNDGNYLVASVYGEWIVSPETRTGQLYLLKIDSEGNTIWEQIIGPKMYHCIIKNLRETIDENLIAMGFYYSDTISEFTLNGWMYKFSKDGDSIWMRDYYYYNNEYDDNLFYDAYPTIDNGHIAIGKARPDLGSSSKMWIIKVDSMGCDTPGCATGTQMFELPTSRVSEMRVWPNPVKNVFWVSCSGFSVGGKKMIRIYNSHGIKVKEVTIPESTETMVIDSKKLSNGLYYIELIINNHQYSNCKLIKY